MGRNSNYRRPQTSQKQQQQQQQQQQKQQRPQLTSSANWCNFVLSSACPYTHVGKKSTCKYLHLDAYARAPTPTLHVRHLMFEHVQTLEADCARVLAARSDAACCALRAKLAQMGWNPRPYGSKEAAEACRHILTHTFNILHCFSVRDAPAVILRAVAAYEDFVCGVDQSEEEDEAAAAVAAKEVCGEWCAAVRTAECPFRGGCGRMHIDDGCGGSRQARPPYLTVEDATRAGQAYVAGFGACGERFGFHVLWNFMAQEGWNAHVLNQPNGWAKAQFVMSLMLEGLHLLPPESAAPITHATIALFERELAMGAAAGSEAVSAVSALSDSCSLPGTSFGGSTAASESEEASCGCAEDDDEEAAPPPAPPVALVAGGDSGSSFVTDDLCERLRALCAAVVEAAAAEENGGCGGGGDHTFVEEEPCYLPAGMLREL